MKVIQSILDQIFEEYSGNTEATTAARAIATTMVKFSFLLGVWV